MTLDVEEDIPAQQHTKATDVIVKTNNLESNPIVQEMFREHVAGLHLLNNKAFEIQYKVCYSYITSWIDTQISCMIYNNIVHNNVYTLAHVAKS